MMKSQVFVTRPLPKVVLEKLAERSEVRCHPEDAPIPAAELAEACREIEGLLVIGTQVTEEVLEKSPRLRVVSAASVGYDNIDVAACTRRGIPVTNTAGVLEETTADLAFALLLAVARRVAEGDRYVRESRWRRWQFSILYGTDVHGKTLGLYGFGRIGQAMARRGLGFSMRILYHARRRVPEEIAHQLQARHVDRETLLRESDYLSLHVPLTPETRHLIGARELGWMKPSAFLINTARGPVVDEEALAQALERRALAGAALDVFEHEPQVHPKLLQFENIVMMPHVGSATTETRLRMATLAAENLLAVLDGRRPPNVVNPEVY